MVLGVTLADCEAYLKAKNDGTYERVVKNCHNKPVDDIAFGE